MPKYRIITNGQIYRVEQEGLFRWSVVCCGPFDKPCEFITKALAEEAIQRWQQQDARDTSVWSVVP